MKLWLISRNDSVGYDEFDSAVVAAETDIEAGRMYPSDGTDIDGTEGGAWVSDVALVDVEYLGEAVDGTQKGVICASYNAG